MFFIKRLMQIKEKQLILEKEKILMLKINNIYLAGLSDELIKNKNIHKELTRLIKKEFKKFKQQNEKF